MSTVTFRKTFEVGGVPHDVTSFTIGVIRTDTSGVVVASGTAMTRVTTGVYECTFTEPTAGLTYTASFSLVYGGSTTAWSESATGSVEESIPLPDLTGDVLVDTLASLLVERLRVARQGPKVTYSIHGHHVEWTQYLDSLDKRMMALRRELAMSQPVEEMGVSF